MQLLQKKLIPDRLVFKKVQKYSGRHNADNLKIISETNELFIIYMVDEKLANFALKPPLV